MTRSDGVVKGGGTLSHNPLNLALLLGLGEAVKDHGLLDGPEQAAGVVGFEKKAVSGVSFRIQMRDGVVNSAGIMCHRKRSVNGTDHLWKSAGFKT